MSCCAPGAEAALLISGSDPASSLLNEMLLASRDLGDGLRQTDLSVPGVHCASCIAAVEKALMALSAVEFARVNLSMKRVSVKWKAVEGAPPDLMSAVRAAGYESHLFAVESNQHDQEYSRLVRALAVAGFCAMNIMLLSVSVWSGADGGTRQAFYWISAALALPAVLYSGRIFFSSALSALRLGRTNMDVPISVGVIMAFGLSLYDTLYDGPHAYFDAATSLLFFLLIGRTLDHVMREKARSAVAGLARLAPRGATIVEPDGQRRYAAIAEIDPGESILVAAGDRIPVDGFVTEGTSDLDCSLVSGEAAPRYAEPGTTVQAGLMNLTGPLTIRTTAREENSFLAEMMRMMEAAEGGRTRYRRLADRASALYSPAVHAIALLSFVGWISLTGDWHTSVTIAIAVLIITCPCALGLAVPIVQVVAARRLFENGIMVKDGGALERLAEIDTVVFDKTGTLTAGKTRLLNLGTIDPSAMATAAAIAAHSRHPFSRAIADAAPAHAAGAQVFTSISEIPGRGMQAILAGATYRLGEANWALDMRTSRRDADASTVLTRDGALLASFAFEDRLRPGAIGAVADLKKAGLSVELLSGDAPAATKAVAEALSIALFHAQVPPGGKVARLADLSAGGSKTMMVGDGLNDAPALSAAYVSMAPATAADIGRNAADFVFLRESLSAVPLALEVSRRADRLIRQNFALAVGYNAVAVPIAVLGHVTPLVAAAAMSMSSLLVIANALRLRPKATRSRTDDARLPVDGAEPRQLVAAE
jgi:Cu2+-exporting ATPase